MKKLPEITLLFWVMKIAATTLGETAGDSLSMVLGLGYLASALLLLVGFVIALTGQMKSTRYHPALYWVVILSTSTVGTEVSDFMNRTLKFGYPMGALILLTGLATVFTIWKMSGTTFDVTRIDTARGESLYWMAILLSNTLGTSLGDFTADDLHLGFGPGAMLFGGIMLLLLLAKYRTSIPTVLLFWAAFVLTRPLGATAGDFFSKPVHLGGLGYGPMGASIILAVVLGLLIVYQAGKQRMRMQLIR